MRNRAAIRSLTDGVNSPAIFISQSGQLPSPPTFSGRLTRFTKGCRQFESTILRELSKPRTPSLHGKRRLKTKTPRNNQPRTIKVKKTPTKGVTMKSPTPKTEPSPATQFRKAVLGGSLKQFSLNRAASKKTNSYESETKSSITGYGNRGRTRVGWRGAGQHRL